MNENNSNEIKEAFEIDIANGGEGLNNNDGKDVEAVRNENKGVDEIERMMSQEEIFSVVKENGLYTNMLAPCLSANIFLDGRILNYFKESMKPIDLQDRVNDVMQVVLHEISKEQNGLVFKPDGTIDVGESIKQSAINGISTIPLLRDTMPDDIVAKLEKHYYDMNRTGMDAAIFIKRSDEKLIENMFSGLRNREVSSYNAFSSSELEKILRDSLRSVKDAIDEHERHEMYHEVFDADSYTDDEKNELNELIEENEKRIEEISKELEPIIETLKKFGKGTPERAAVMGDFKRLNGERKKLIYEINAIGNVEDDSLEEIEAKGITATISIMKKLGIESNEYHELSKRLTKLNMDPSSKKLSRMATRSESISRTVERNYLTKMAKNDIKQLKTFKDKAIEGFISEESRNAYLITAVKNYITYMSLNNDKASQVISQDLVKYNIEQALDGIMTLIPNVKNENGELDADKIVDAVNKVPGYENITKENLRTVFAIQKGNEISQDLQTLVKSAELDLHEHAEYDETSFLDNFKEEDKEVELCRYINYARRLDEKGINTSTTRMFKMKLKKEGMEYIFDRADETYEDTKGFTDETMNNYKKIHAFSKYKKFKSYTDNELKKLTNEEIGSIVSSLIAAYDVSRDDSNMSNEIQIAAKEVFKTFLGDVFDKDGNIDDNKLFEEYKNSQSTGKYALGKYSENITDFFSFHEQMSLTKVQGKLISNFMATINDREKEEFDNPFITQEEADRVIGRKQEVLDTSAITSLGDKNEIDVTLPITQEEGHRIMSDRGEEIHVGELKSDKEDTVLEENGNKAAAQVEKLNANAALPTKVNDNFLSKFMRNAKKAANVVKEFISKVKNVFKHSNSSESNNSSASSNAGQGMEEKQSQTDDIFRPVEIDYSIIKPDSSKGVVKSSEVLKDEASYEVEEK